MGCEKKQIVLGKCRSEIKRPEPDAMLNIAAFGSVLAEFTLGAVHFFTETFSQIGLLAEAGLQDDLSDGKCGFCYLRDLFSMFWQYLNNFCRYFHIIFSI